MDPIIIYRMKKEKSKVIEAFIKASMLQAEATVEADNKKGNHNYNIIVESARKLRDQGQLFLLESLLEHDNVGVKIWASTYLLETNQSRALQILENIAGQNILHHSFTAQMILDEWEQGNLILQF